MNSQTGLNLRNEFAHGLAREHHASPEVAGIELVCLYLLAELAEQEGLRATKAYLGRQCLTAWCSGAE